MFWIVLTKKIDIKAINLKLHIRLHIIKIIKNFILLFIYIYKDFNYSDNFFILNSLPITYYNI